MIRDADAIRPLTGTIIIFQPVALHDDNIVVVADLYNPSYTELSYSVYTYIRIYR